ncbi:hypothetical protein ACWOAH_09960 [Vagococcus vulneris]|uniref:Phage head-tail adapter protein n=1 Tax=Vagococcus vulneris TaxID=1977869 RepID=A0A429ZWU3_9ENTE|nr:hypothetical protein [Vagococcus vulneris]RST98263.1 hypothetical protein CBF37_08090 [Vagococcus vulneris]
MRLYEIALFEKIKTGEKDRLGNDITEIKLFETGEGRKSTWTADEIALDSRIVTKKLQKVIATLSTKTLQKAFYLELNGNRFEIEEIKGEDDERWRVVYLKAYGK